MIALGAIFAVALLAQAYVLTKHFQGQANAWATERRELLNRIQKPEYVPVTQAEPPPLPEYEADEIDRVGSIDYARPEDDEIDDVGVVAE